NKTGRDISNKQYQQNTGTRSTPSTPSYSNNSRSTPNYNNSRSNPAPVSKSGGKVVDVGGGYTARTNPNGGIQYRNERTGKDVSSKEFESARGMSGRVNPNGGIQFKDNRTGRDVSQHVVRSTYNGRPTSDYRSTTVGGNSQRWNNYRSST